MIADEYVPSEEQVRGWVNVGALRVSGEKDGDLAFDRFLAQVRRDVLTALADHWDEKVSEHAERPLFSASGTHVRHYRDAHYPEETP